MAERRSSVNRKTTSLIDEFEEFYGRDADKKAIIDMLISDDDNGSNPGVIPIVGMGGVGKTTLAQHVYNDKAVEEHFKIRAWVCVSDQFDETNVTKEIFEKVTETTCRYGHMDQLQRELKRELNRRKFLLVLDDVWSEDYETWRQLLTPLRSGAKGSKLIITTRSQEAASKVQTVPTHYLRVLKDEDCWNLFARHACLDVNSTANFELQEIGKEIVRKCRGLPLAARALGGVLRWQTKAEKWKQVLKSEIWDVQNANILPALALSYIHLTSHLKRCFAYCAIFPQDYRFQKKKLVALWMSEGFLVRQKGNQSLEEKGDMLFDDLVSRSFFQRKDDYFVMHDLVHDLARFVSGEFCSRLGGGISRKIGERIRHLSYERTNQDALKKFEGIHKTPFLHSFVLAQQSRVYCDIKRRNICIDKEVIDGLVLTRKLLRILFLSCYSIRELPNSIGNLKHMRHLDLSRTSIRLLPEAVTALFNLEILILRECWRLVELPADMARLINLCQLDLNGTYLQRMPPEMGKLKKLSQLSHFYVGENEGSNIEELGHLHYLRGRISIRGLKNVKNDRNASEVILRDKENLKVLELSWGRYDDDSREVKQVLERLQPHTLIECIKIWGYGGTEFPNWVGDISFSKLKKLHLQECKNFICLPPLGQLASLEELIIQGGHGAALEAIGVEFYGKCKPGEKPFPSLKRLVFDSMMNWREWTSCSGAFPVLEELELRCCAKLMSVPNHLPSLKRLRVDNCGELGFQNLLISTCATLESVDIRRMEKVKCISVEIFPNLKELAIWDCSSLESLGSTAAATTTRTSDPGLSPSLVKLISLCYKLISLCSTAATAATTTRTSDPLFSPSLTSLVIRGCPKLVSFLGGGLHAHAPNLKSMIIEHCDSLKSLPQGMHSLLPSLERLVISHCPEIESFPDGGLPSKLQSLEIELCEKLVSFPRGGLHAPYLNSMKISRCRNLKSLPLDMHSLLPSLVQLSISGCPEIESLGGLPSELQSLTIKGCGKLVDGRMQWGLQSLPSLSSISIQGESCEDVESSFPEEALLPLSLQSLQISGFAKMKSLSYKGLQYLSSLQYLEIGHCMKLESLPKEGLPASLSSLFIFGCPLLEKRCERETGEDWPKIKHIPDLYID